MYVEPSIISYLAARPSRDLVTAARQELTREWWKQRRKTFEVYTPYFAVMGYPLRSRRRKILGYGGMLANLFGMVACDELRTVQLRGPCGVRKS